MPQAPQLLLSVRVLVQVPQEVGLSAIRAEQAGRWYDALACLEICTVRQSGLYLRAAGEYLKYSDIVGNFW